MKNLLLRFFNIISDKLPLDFLIKNTNQRLFLPFYHSISNKDLIHIKHLYPIRNEKQFKEDLDFLLKYFSPIDLTELKKIIENHKELSTNCFFLSFDDGLSEIYNIAAPILKQKGIPATIFLNSKFVDNQDLFYRYKASILVDAFQRKRQSQSVKAKIKEICLKHFIQCRDINSCILKINYNHKYVLDEIAKVLEIDFQLYLNEEKPYLTTRQILELIKDGFAVGAHSIDHPEYNTITLDNQLKQTKESIQFVQDKFRLKYRIFSFPFTDVDVPRVFFEKIFHTPHRIVDISFGSAGLKKDSYTRHIHRFSMEKTHLSAQRVIITEYLYYLLKIFFRKNIIKRK